MVESRSRKNRGSIEGYRRLLDGSVVVKASTLQRIYPELLPVQLDADYLFPVSLKSVVLQVQAHLQQDLGEVPKPIGPDFDTPIAQVAREDEGFFKLEQLAEPPRRRPRKGRDKANSEEPTLTPADRPALPVSETSLARKAQNRSQLSRPARFAHQ